MELIKVLSSVATHFINDSNSRSYVKDSNMSNCFPNGLQTTGAPNGNVIEFGCESTQPCSHSSIDLGFLLEPSIYCLFVCLLLYILNT